jgi:hypothetical protein
VLWTGCLAWGIMPCYEPVTHRDLAFRYAYDPLVACKGYLASLTLTQMGYLDQALRRIDEAIAYADTLSHRPSTAFALLHACIAISSVATNGCCANARRP